MYFYLIFIKRENVQIDCYENVKITINCPSVFVDFYFM